MPKSLHTLRRICNDCENVGYYEEPWGRCIVCRGRVEHVKRRGWVPFYVLVNHSIDPWFVAWFAKRIEDLPMERENWGDRDVLRVYARPQSFNPRIGKLPPQFIVDLFSGQWRLYPWERVDNVFRAR